MLKKWFEVKKWTLVSKKLDLGHVKEKMSTQIELSGKMGWGDQELSRSTEFQNFEVIVKSIWWFEIQKVGIQTKNLWKNGEFGDFWWYLGGLKWFEVKKWSLRFKKLDLGHVKEKMLTQIELSGKMGWGDQELSRSTEFQNFWVVVKVNEANFRYLKAINGLKL